jgi:hypothetical protein
MNTKRPEPKPTLLDRIPAHRAWTNAARLAKALGCTMQLATAHCDNRHDPRTHLEVVGSLVRQEWGGDIDWDKRGPVHDVDLIAGIPDEGQDDVLYDNLRALLGDTKAAEKNPLFAEQAAPPSPYGTATSGLAPRFKKCVVEMPLPGDPAQSDLGWSQPFTLKIEIHRYTPGAQGNKGWVQMIRTGPGAKSEEELGWGEMMLWRWKQRNPGGSSVHAYPTFANGTRQPVPDEERAFSLVGLRWIEPRLRTTVLAKQLANAQRRDGGVP